MLRETVQSGDPRVNQDAENRRALLLKYNAMSLDQLTHEKASLEADLSKDFFEILHANHVDTKPIDGHKLMERVIEEYISDGEIDENDPLTAQWLEKSALFRTLEQIIQAKHGEREQAEQYVDHEKIIQNVDRIRAIAGTLQSLTGIDQMSIKESLIEINTLIEKQKNLDAYNLSKKLIRDLESKYKLNLEQQKDQVKTNYDLLLAKAKIAAQFGLQFPPELVKVLSELTKKAQNEYVSKALQITKQMNDFVDGWLRDQEGGMSALLQVNSSDKKLQEREAKKRNTVQEAFQRLKTEAKKIALSESALPFADIQTFIDQGNLDSAMNEIDQALSYVQLTKKPELTNEKKSIVLNPLETPLTQAELKEKNLEYVSETIDQKNVIKNQAERVIKKTQERLDYAVTHPDTLTEKEENVLRNMMKQIEEALEQSDLKKAESKIEKLSKTAALLAPLESDYDYKKNTFDKKARKQLSRKRELGATVISAPPDAIFEQNPENVWQDVVLPETVIVPAEKPILPETKINKPTAKNTPAPRPVENSDLPITEKIQISDLEGTTDEVPVNDDDILRSTNLPPRQTLEKISPPISEITKPTPESSFDDTEPFIEDESDDETEPLAQEVSSEVKTQATAGTDFTQEEQNFFAEGNKIDAEQQALAQERRGFFGKIFDTLRPVQKSPEDKLTRLLQKEKWLQNIPNMSHKDVLVSLKKFGVDLTGGAVDEQLRHVGPLLRSNTETGEVFKALWDKYLETQIHEKKKWEEAIPNMDIDHVYMNLEKFGINPDEDGRRDVKAKIVALRNEPGKRGEVFRMLFDRYIEIQNNNIRALRTSDKKQIIKFLKTEYKIDPTYYFEDTKNEKIIQQQKHIEEIRSEYSTRGKVIEAAMKRLEQLHEEKLRSTSK